MKRQFLEVGDLPKDGTSALHKLRPTLVRVFNTARTSPAKMKLLKDTMKYVYNACVAHEKALAKQTQLEAEAKKAADDATGEPESTGTGDNTADTGDTSESTN